jgi:hypothetical protein
VSFLGVGRSATLAEQSGAAKAMSNQFTPAARHSIREARRARADQAIAELAPIIAELRAAGVTSLRGRTHRGFLMSEPNCPKCNVPMRLMRVVPSMLVAARVGAR